MISFIVCSVKPERLENLRRNIESTIGAEFEMVVVDNRTAGYSLTQAYNVGAQQAKYPYLCFAHEDILFLDQNWAQSIIDQMAKPDTGVIGFAGASGKPKTMSTWAFYKDFHRQNMRETADGVSHDISINPRSEKFSQVITLDGLCLFVRADVWREVRFDEVLLDGFHLYDLDFTTAVAVAGYKNYVCHTFAVEHLSKGSFDRVWMKYSKIYHKKWADHLPLYVESLPRKKIESVERTTHRRNAYFIVKRNLLPQDEMRQLVCRNIRLFPFRPDSYLLWLRMKKNIKKNQ